jgi:NADH dehydrogenase [ubiquinone] 1 alpha subcomplex assembly factor 5
MHMYFYFMSLFWTGFALPTIDVDTIQLSYPNAFILMEHLQRMGEGHASFNRHYSVGSDTFLAMASLYQNLYNVEQHHQQTTHNSQETIANDNNQAKSIEVEVEEEEENEDGVIATFQIIYMIGWSPHNSQPKPCQRGTAVKSLKDM